MKMLGLDTRAMGCFSDVLRVDFSVTKERGTKRYQSWHNAEKRARAEPPI